MSALSWEGEGVRREADGGSAAAASQKDLQSVGAASAGAALETWAASEDAGALAGSVGLAGVSAAGVTVERWSRPQPQSAAPRARIKSARPMGCLRGSRGRL